MLNLTLFKSSMKHRVFGLIVLPILIWLALYFTRDLTYSLWCAVVPSPCVMSSINPIDQLAFHYRSITADFISNIVQNCVGALAFLFPWLLVYVAKKLKKRDALEENSFLLGSLLWNGAAIELTRLVVQRPRPLVFDSPMTEGLNVDQYSSFYSGHTSFVALASVNLFFLVRNYFPKREWLHWAVIIFGTVATTATGVLRVYGGRHYPTDVLCGAIAGVFIAFGIRRFFEE